MNKIYEIQKVNIADHASITHGFLFEKIEFCHSFRMHWHSYYEIEYVVCGEMREICNGSEAVLSQGMLRLLTPSDFHEVHAERTVTLYKACFDASLLERELAARLYQASLGRAISLSEEACHLIEGIFESALLAKEWGASDAGFSAVKKKLTEALVSVLLFEYEKVGADEKRGRKDVVSDVLAYIHENYKHNITLLEIAKNVYLSPGYVSKCFHKSTNMTLQEYIKRLRMDYAARLLIHTASDITEVCMEVGFSSLPSFSAEFKRIYGVSPMAYRRAFADKESK